MKSNAALLTAFFRILFKKRRCDKTVKTSVVEAEKHRFGGFRTSIQLVCFGTRLCEDNKEVATFMSQPLFFYRC